MQELSNELSMRIAWTDVPYSRECLMCNFRPTNKVAASFAMAMASFHVDISIKS